MSIAKEFHGNIWKFFPRKMMVRLENPVWGKGTAVASQSRWCFTREVPMIVQMLKEQGDFQYEGFTVKFGSPEIFVHKIKYASSR